MAPKGSVLITGCSDGGIGSALAIVFQQRGYHVFATTCNIDKMSELRGLSNITSNKRISPLLSMPFREQREGPWHTWSTAMAATTSCRSSMRTSKKPRISSISMSGVPLRWQRLSRHLSSRPKGRLSTSPRLPATWMCRTWVSYEARTSRSMKEDSGLTLRLVNRRLRCIEAFYGNHSRDSPPWTGAIWCICAVYRNRSRQDKLPELLSGLETSRGLSLQAHRANHCGESSRRGRRQKNWPNGIRRKGGQRDCGRVNGQGLVWQYGRINQIYGDIFSLVDGKSYLSSDRLLQSAQLANLDYWLAYTLHRIIPLSEALGWMFSRSRSSKLHSA